MARNLILCFDGTWNKIHDPLPPAASPGPPADGPAPNNTPELAPVENPENTNVVKLKRLIEEEQGDQVLLYFNGVGTDWYDRLRGGISGEGLSKRIKLAFFHLSENYIFGDRIFLFGFSRGAYTARSLGGLIRKCGVLRVPNMDDVDAAYDLYRRRDPTPDALDVIKFRNENSAQVDIHFMGVWDTVGELGIPLTLFAGLDNALWGFHDTNLSAIVHNAYHALAVDEHRVQFKPTLWTSEPAPGRTMEQRWFVGAHSNVGGGYTDAHLSDLALEWMCRKAAARGLGLADFKAAPGSHMGLIRDSYAEFLSALPKTDPPFFRPVQPGPFQQKIDDSVSERNQDDPTYRPPNLAGVVPGFDLT